MKWFTERTAALGFAVIFAFLIVNGVISFKAVEVLIGNQDWVVHSHEVIAGIDDLQSTLIDAESGQRGFIITGKDSYLTTYSRAVSRMDSLIGRIATITIDNPHQQARVPMLRSLAHERLGTLQHNIDLRKTQGFDAAGNSISIGYGKQIMDSIRGVINAMNSEETVLLRLRLIESGQSGRNAVLTLILANGVAILLVVSVYLLLNRNIRARQNREIELRRTQDLLEQRVRERTAELTQANEALQAEIVVRQRTQARLGEFTIELERSNRELQDFAFVASHDLQEPLRKIQAFGDRLKRKYGELLQGDGLDYVERMQNAAQRMHNLINDLLTFSRIASKAQPFVQVDLAEIAAGVLGDLEVRIQQTHAAVDVESLPAIDADPLQMRQLLQNLIGNALKFHRPDAAPLVHVRGRVLAPATPGDAGLCEITVEDNGIGFEEQYLEKIFTPFQRLHSRQEYEGTGMGLAVCRKIAERHNGSITARSTPGVGTTFIVQLPIRHNKSRT